MEQETKTTTETVTTISPSGILETYGKARAASRAAFKKSVDHIRDDIRESVKKILNPKKNPKIKEAVKFTPAPTLSKNIAENGIRLQKKDFKTYSSDLPQKTEKETTEEKKDILIDESTRTETLTYRVRPVGQFLDRFRPDSPKDAALSFIAGGVTGFAIRRATSGGLGLLSLSATPASAIIVGALAGAGTGAVKEYLKQKSEYAKLVKESKTTDPLIGQATKTEVIQFKTDWHKITHAAARGLIMGAVGGFIGFEITGWASDHLPAVIDNIKHFVSDHTPHIDLTPKPILRPSVIPTPVSYEEPPSPPVPIRPQPNIPVANSDELIRELTTRNTERAAEEAGKQAAEAKAAILQAQFEEVQRQIQTHASPPIPTITIPSPTIITPFQPEPDLNKIFNLDIKISAPGDTFWKDLRIPKEFFPTGLDHGWINPLNGVSQEDVMKDMIIKMAKANGHNLDMINVGDDYQLKDLLTADDLNVLKQAAAAKDAQDYWNNIRPAFENHLAHKALKAA